MCGFLIEYTLQQNLTPKAEFVEVLNRSQMRGPDAQGYWTNNKNVQLGFNRLAIIDLSQAGHQPMSSYTNRYSIVFNGEIYNHNELRKKLNFSNFKGHSDTETILAGFEEWGIAKTIRELDGMFAIVVFDKSTNEIHLIRDFAGIKPLFYGVVEEGVVAASQYDQLLAHPFLQKQQIDEHVLKLYLKQHFIPAPLGLYKETFQVKPGEMLTISPEGKVKKTMFWEFPQNKDKLITSEREAQERISETLERAIKDQLVADVPIGAFLSGGVDSPLICSYAKKIQKNLPVFSIGSDSAVHDESERAKQFANAMELDQYLWKLDAKEVMQYWEEALGALHEPLADFSIIPTFLVSKLAKQKVKVALSGDGADELFLGYERFWSVGKNVKYQKYPLLVRKGIYGWDKYVTGNKKVNSLVLLDSQAKAQEGLHSRFSDSWLNKIAPNLTHKNWPGAGIGYEYKNQENETGLMMEMRKAEFYGMMQKTLRKVDLASMGNSLEVRVPFLQKEMIETSLLVDPMLNYGDGRQKKMLKKILQQRVVNVPEEKVKKGFSVPLSKWIREELKAEFQEKLLESNLETFGFEKKQVENMINSHLNGHEDLKWPLFTLYALTKWRR